MLPKLPDEDEGGMLLMLLLLAQPTAAVRRRQRAAWPDVDLTRRTRRFGYEICSGYRLEGHSGTVHTRLVHTSNLLP